MARVRDVVVGRADLDVAFLYLRDHHPAVALVGTPVALAPGSDAVADIVAATGIVYGEPMTVVAMAPDLDVLDALLGVAPPLGAGGALEVDLAAVATAAIAGGPDDAEEGDDGDGDATPGRRAAVRAVAGLVEATVVVPTRSAGAPAGHLDLPAARRGDGTAVGVFTSPFAQYHSVGPRPCATLAGWALVEALPADTDLVVDPGLPWAWRPHRDLLRRLARRTPAEP